MKAEDPDTYERVKSNEEKILKGERDSLGREVSLAEEDALVELEDGDHFWADLAMRLEAAVPPDGTYPEPVQETHVLEKHGIRHPENQRYVSDTVAWYWAGRAEGLSTRFDKKSKSK